MTRQETEEYLTDIRVMIESLQLTVNTIEEKNNSSNYMEQRKVLWNLRTLKSICVELGEEVDSQGNKLVSFVFTVFNDQTFGLGAFQFKPHRCTRFSKRCKA